MKALLTTLVGAAAKAAAILALLTAATPLPSQPTVREPRFTLPMVAPPAYTTALRPLGDTNGDGFGDFASSIRNIQTLGSEVRVYSGRDANLLFYAPGPNSSAFGWSLGSADVNGDGRPDLLVGAPQLQTSQTVYAVGAVYVYSGADWTLLGVVPATRFFSSAYYSWQGFGQAVAGLGDIDGDGHDDVAIGAYVQEANADGTRGRVVVLSGRTFGLLQVLDGNTSPPTHDTFGGALSGSGDIDGDGVNDLIVGDTSPRASNPQGRAMVFSGRTLNLYRTLSVPTGAAGQGWRVSDAGDVDGDGRHDVLSSSSSPSLPYYSCYLFRTSGPVAVFQGFGAGIGDADGDGRADFVVGFPTWNPLGWNSPPYPGRADVYSGATLQVIASSVGDPTHNDLLGTLACGAGDVNADGYRDYMFLTANSSASGTRIEVCLGGPAPRDLPRIDGGTANDRLGYAVSIVGDLDGDGRDDVAAGAPGGGSTMPGHVLIVLSTGARIRVDGDAPGDAFGFSVGRAGDVDGDGHDDVVVGAPAHAGAGLVRVLSGADPQRTLMRLHAANAGDLFGYSVSGAGDVDGDGYDDVVVGAPGRDWNGRVDAGAATVFSGKDGRVLFTVGGSAAADGLGRSVHGAGDLDGDGLADIVVGVPGDDGNGGEAGLVRVLFGPAGVTSRDWPGLAAGDRFGSTVAGAGDVDGDGVVDLIASAPRTAGAFGCTVRVLSGATGLDLHVVPVSPQSRGIDFAVASAGDVNGDGYGDFAIGNETSSVGTVRVHSGFDAAVLMHQLRGNLIADSFGRAVGGGGDVDGNGFDDVVVGAPLADNGGTDTGSLSVHTFDYGGPAVLRPGTLRTYGAACVGGSQRLPRIGARGRPRIGETFTVTLRGATLTPTTAILMLGTRTSLPLAAIGMPGCFLLASPATQLGASVSSGAARMPIAIPADRALLAATASYQWVVIDAQAPYALPLATSNGLGTLLGAAVRR